MADAIEQTVQQMRTIYGALLFMSLLLVTYRGRRLLGLPRKPKIDMTRQSLTA